MSRMGRPRKAGRRDLPAGLYLDGKGYKARHPGTGKFVRLGRDKVVAVRLHDELRARWEGDAIEAKASALAARLQAVGLPSETFTAYCGQYRRDVLPAAAGRQGKPLGDETRGAYERMLRNSVERDPILQVPAVAIDEVVLRKYLAQWLDNPPMYNYRLALLSRVCKRMVDEGLLRANPCRAIDRRSTVKRRTYIPDEDFLAIVGQLRCWERLLCEWLYVVSHNPTDCLTVREEQVTVFEPPRADPDGTVVYGEVAISRAKTGEAVTIGLTEYPWEVYQTLLAIKREEGILSPHVAVYTTEFRRPLIGKPVSSEYLSRRFQAASRAAGFEPGQYQLRDLRPKGLTDEAKIAGKATDKGAHKTEAMKQHYVRVSVPRVVRANVRRIG